MLIEKQKEYKFLSSLNKRIMSDYIDLIIDANKKFNLISKSTEKIIWHRHVLDSAQLVKFIDFNVNSMADLGTGA